MRMLYAECVPVHFLVALHLVLVLVQYASARVCLIGVFAAEQTEAPHSTLVLSGGSLQFGQDILPRLLRKALKKERIKCYSDGSAI